MNHLGTASLAEARNGYFQQQTPLFDTISTTKLTLCPRRAVRGSNSLHLQVGTLLDPDAVRGNLMGDPSHVTAFVETFPLRGVSRKRLRT